MLNRQVNVMKADGSWGPAGVSLNDYGYHSYNTPVPSNEREAESIRSLIAEDFEKSTKAKQPRNVSNRRSGSSFSVITPCKCGKHNHHKELVYRHRKASDFKLFSDGTWDFNEVSSEDKNSKYLTE